MKRWSKPSSRPRAPADGSADIGVAAARAQRAYWPAGQRLTRRAALALAAVGLLAVPLLLGSFYRDLTNLVLMATLGALALTLLTGVAGQVSVGNAALMAVGGFAAASMSTQLHLPLPVSILAASVMAGCAGFLVGVPALRLRGLYLVLATLALHYIVVYAGRRYQLHVAGPAGFVLPVGRIGTIPVGDLRAWYLLLVVCVVLITVAVARLLDSRFGRAWRALKQREEMAQAVGIDCTKYKLLAFTVSSMIIGFQGGLLAYYVRVVSIDYYTLDLAIQYLAMVIIGGQGTILGAYLGAALVTLLPYVVRNAVGHIPSGLPGASVVTAHTFDVQAGLYGLGIILVLTFEPGGLVRLWRRALGYWRSWPLGPDAERAEGG